jgi:pSer/pThr/pTyr-binding forkhead associated (FHA) protein
MPKLQITLPDGSQLDHELTGEAVTIGRAADNTFELDAAGLSGHHARIAAAGDGYILQDLGSTNGTRINGAQCEAQVEYPLNPGARLAFGSLQAVYDPDNATDEEQQELPKDDHVAKVAKSSSKPSNFMNESPFQKKNEKKDSVGMGIYAFAGVALLALLAVLAMIFGMTAR